MKLKILSELNPHGLANETIKRIKSIIITTMIIGSMQIF